MKSTTTLLIIAFMLLLSPTKTMAQDKDAIENLTI